MSVVHDSGIDIRHDCRHRRSVLKVSIVVLTASLARVPLDDRKISFTFDSERAMEGSNIPTNVLSAYCWVNRLQVSVRFSSSRRCRVIAEIRSSVKLKMFLTLSSVF